MEQLCLSRWFKDSRMYSQLVVDAGYCLSCQCLQCLDHPVTAFTWILLGHVLWASTSPKTHCRCFKETSNTVGQGSLHIFIQCLQRFVVISKNDRSKRSESCSTHSPWIFCEVFMERSEKGGASVFVHTSPAATAGLCLPVLTRCPSVPQRDSPHQPLKPSFYTIIS